jgi:hypothetical protein
VTAKRDRVARLTRIERKLDALLARRTPEDAHVANITG